MRSHNKVTLIGNVGKDPDYQVLEGNIPVAKITLATTETYKDRTGMAHAETEWHTVVLWRGLADLAQRFIHKGSYVFVEGKLKTRTFDDKDGNRRHITEIVADELIMLDRKPEQPKA